MPSSRSNADTHVLLSQMIDEIMERLARGESPKLNEYASRHPELADILQETMPVLNLASLYNLIREYEQASRLFDELELLTGELGTDIERRESATRQTGYGDRAS